MYQGYVKIWRQSLKKGWLTNHKLWAFWCYCLLKATHRPCKVLIGFKEVNLEPGQFIFGRRQAAKDIGLSEKSVRTCLHALKTANNVAVKTASKFSIITIINWHTYQDDDGLTGQQKGQQDGQQGASKGPARGHIQECRRMLKNEEEELMGPLTRTKPTRRRQLPSDFVLTDELTSFAINAGISSTQVEQIFSQFCDHHRAKGTTLIDWSAGWRTWCRNEIKFNHGRRTPPEEIPGFDWSKP